MQNLLLGIVVVLLVWLVVLTYLFLKLKTKYELITKDGSRMSLAEILENITTELHKSNLAITHLAKRSDNLEKQEKKHIQKIGLLRFNPFKDTGGDQSFILSLVDAEENGIVMSGLYSRAGTRWYAKKIKNGIGADYELSEEEQKAVRLAKSSNSS